MLRNFAKRAIPLATIEIRPGRSREVATSSKDLEVNRILSSLTGGIIDRTGCILLNACSFFNLYEREIHKVFEGDYC